MIVSHKHRFIYVRTRKTGSTALEISLSRLVGPDDIVTPFCARDEVLRQTVGGAPPQNLAKVNGVSPYNHMPASQIRQFVGGEVWDNYLTFTVDRDPFEKVVSLYFHRYKNDPRPSLQSFLDSGEFLDAYNRPLYTVDDAVVVNLVGNYEHLGVFVREVERRLAVVIPPLPLAKAQFRLDSRPADAILSPAQRDLIAQSFEGEPMHLPGQAWVEQHEENCVY